MIKKDLSLIYNYLISIGAAKEDAEDIVQETFIKTYENIDILIDGNIKAWMFKVSINKFYTLYKKSKVNISLTDELSAAIEGAFKIGYVDNAIDNKLITFYWVDNNSEKEKQRIMQVGVPAFDFVGIKATSLQGQLEHGPREIKENFKEAVKKLKEIGHDQDVQNIDENNF